MERYGINGIGGVITFEITKKYIVKVSSQQGDPACIELLCLEMDRICEPFPKVVVGSKWLDEVDEKTISYLRIRHPQLRGSILISQIDLLTGPQYYYQVFTGASKRMGPDLMLVESIFGLFFHGVASDTAKLCPGTE